MAYLLRITAEADREYSESADWYEQQRKGLGLRFIEIVERKLAIITANPFRYPVRKYNFREAPIRIFPYLIIYKAYTRKKEIAVYAIFHSSRNPKTKYRRK